MTEQAYGAEFLQKKVYPAKAVRQLIGDMFGNTEQVLSGLAVSAVSGYQVSVAAGSAVVQGDTNPNQGMYRVFNDAAKTLTHTPHATLPRIDRIVYRVYDSTEVGSGTDAEAIEIVQGTATSGANLVNETGIAALPASAIPLAKIMVEPSPATINVGDIEDDRVLAGVGTNGPSKGVFSAYRGSALSLATDSLIVFGNEEFDVSGWFSTATGLFTPQVAGYYRLSWAAAPGSAVLSDDVYWGTALEKNGALFKRGSRSWSRGSAPLNSVGSVVVTANGTTDNFGVRVLHDQGGSVALTNDAAYTYFHGEFVGQL